MSPAKKSAAARKSIAAKKLAVVKNLAAKKIVSKADQGTRKAGKAGKATKAAPYTDKLIRQVRHELNRIEDFLKIFLPLTREDLWPKDIIEVCVKFTAPTNPDNGSGSLCQIYVRTKMFPLHLDQQYGWTAAEALKKSMLVLLDFVNAEISERRDRNPKRVMENEITSVGTKLKFVIEDVLEIVNKEHPQSALRLALDFEIPRSMASEARGKD